jgi:hypothetical protein
MEDYLYLIQTGEDIGTNIYKIGKTVREPHKRLRGYDKDTKTICFQAVDDCHNRENELKALFNNKFRLARGREYFEGNKKAMEEEFSKFVNQDKIREIRLGEENKLIDDEEIINDNYINIKIDVEENIQDIKEDINLSKFKCNLCNNIFISKFSLERHQEKKVKCNEPTVYQCKKCNRYFKEKRNLLQHIEKKLCKIIIPQTEIPQIEIPQVVIKLDNKSKCNLCNSIFINKYSLERHQLKINKCNEPTNYKCKICNKYFREKRNLLQHVEKNICKIIISEKIIHQPVVNIDNKNNNNHTCNLCNINFDNKYSLERHRNKKLKCNKVININNNLIDQLNNIIIIDQKNKNIINKCNLCNKTFSNNYSLERHQKRKILCSKLTEYQCIKCKSCFAQKKSLIYHANNNICLNNNEDFLKKELLNIIKTYKNVNTKTNYNKTII